MNCKQCSEHLIDYNRDELPPNIRWTIAGHLSTCDLCRTELARLQQLDILLDRTEQPSHELQSKFAARLAAEINRPDHIPAQPVRVGLFQALWPSRPLAAMCYFFALLACRCSSDIGQQAPASGTKVLSTMSNRAKLFIPGAFFIAILGLLLFALGRNPNQVPSALVNRPLPTFSRANLLDETQIITSEQIRGGVFIVNVWATWCPPCHAEHPYLVEISERESGVTFVGVNYKDDVNAAREYLSERGNPFKLTVMDLDGSLGIDLGVAGPPETFVVDKTGTIRYRHVGVIDNKVWSEVFAPLIAQIQ